MLKRHEIQVLRRAEHSLAEVAEFSGVSVRTVRRVTERHRRRRSTIFTTNKTSGRGAVSSTMVTWRTRSSTASSSAVACSSSTARRSGPSIFSLTTTCGVSQIKWPQFPELTGQSFRNPHGGDFLSRSSPHELLGDDEGIQTESRVLFASTRLS